MPDRNLEFLALVALASAIITGGSALYGLTQETKIALETIQLCSIMFPIQLVFGLLWQLFVKKDLEYGEALTWIEEYGVLVLAAVCSVLLAFLVWNTI
jgi:hypothetical protein